MQNRVLDRRDQAEIKATLTSFYRGSKSQFGHQGHSIHQEIEEDVEIDSVENQTTRSFTTDVPFVMGRFLNDNTEQAHNDDALSMVVDDQAFAPLITPASLLEAVRNQDVKRVKAILSRDEDFSSRTTEGLSTLHYCAFHNDAEMAELLLSHGADVDAKDGQLRSPFMLAITCNAFEVAVVLLSHGCQIDDAPQVLAQTVPREKDGTIPKDYLVCLRSRLSVRERGALMQSVILADDIQTLELFLRSGFEASGRDHVGKSNRPFIPSFEETIVTRTQLGLPLLFFALMHQKISTIGLLAKSGANVNESVPTTVFKDSDPSLPRLDDMVAMKGGVLPLEVATRVFNCINMTRLLLDLGADPNIRKHTPNGALHSDNSFKAV